MEKALLSIRQASAYLAISPKSLQDKRYRSRIGLCAIKIGKRTLIRQADLDKLIAHSREHLPGEGRR